MELKLPVKLNLNLHAHLETPLGDCHANLEVIDEDNDGDPELKLKWNLPGRALDSGPEGIKVELPAASLVKGLLSPLVDAAVSAAPAPVAKLLKSVLG